MGQSLTQLLSVASCRAEVNHLPPADQDAARPSSIFSIESSRAFDGYVSIERRPAARPAVAGSLRLLNTFFFFGLSFTRLTERQVRSPVAHPIPPVHAAEGLFLFLPFSEKLV